MSADARENTHTRKQVLTSVAMIVLLSLLVRLPILFTSEAHLRSDEACVGLMAKHIFTRGALPIFLYGQAYGGGHAIIAYIAALPFRLFGTSAILLTAVTMTFSIGAVIVFYLIALRHFGRWVATVAACLYAIAPPALSASFLVNGNMVTMFLSLLGLWLFMDIYFNRKGGLVSAFLLGLLCGAAYYGMVRRGEGVRLVADNRQQPPGLQREDVDLGGPFLKQAFGRPCAAAIRRAVDIRRIRGATFPMSGLLCSLALFLKFLS